MSGLVVTRILPEPIRDRAAAEFGARFLDVEGAFDAEHFLAGLEGADSVLVTPADKLTADVIKRLPSSLKVIGTFSVGFEHIDLEAAKARGLPVVNTPGVLSFATAEIALMLMLMAARRAGEGERVLRGGRWTGWGPNYFLGTSLEGKRLGILGMGRIGRVLARMAQGLSMQVSYHNRNRLRPEDEEGATFIADEAEFLGQCDVLSIHLPGGEATRHWLNAERIERLPQRAIVVNTGRGTTIDDDALASALRSGRLAAAGLDVFAKEPSVPEAYLALENVVLLPHLGSATHETRRAMGMLALDGIAAILAGREPENRIV